VLCSSTGKKKNPTITRSYLSLIPDYRWVLLISVESIVRTIIQMEQDYMLGMRLWMESDRYFSLENYNSK
jgi:hypothetical protein